MALARAIATVGGLTMVSRVLGFVRDILIAAVLGAGPIADAFFTAFRLPNLFRRLFAEGAFNAAFVPLFSRALTGSDGASSEARRAAARLFAEDALAVLLTALLVLLIVAELFMPLLVSGLAPGFLDAPATFERAVTLSRITFPYLVFMSLTALASGVLNGLGRFAAAAAAPVLLNVVLIAAMVGFADSAATGAEALAWGVALAGVLQFLWLARSLRQAGFALRLPRPRLTPAVRRMLRLMAPGAIGAGVMQINLVVGHLLASLIGAGAISWLYFADRLVQLPLGVVGVAVGIALLPLLSRQVRSGDQAAAADSQNRAIEMALLLTLPATAALLTIPGPMIAVLFERGAFAAADSRATTLAVMAYATGLPAFVVVKALAPGFFAREDTATPVKVAVAAMAANLLLALALMAPLGHVGIALATSLASWLNVALLGGLLMRRGHWRPDGRLLRRTVRMIVASAVMSVGLVLAAAALDGWLAAPAGVRPVLALALLVGLGGGLFAGLALACRATSLQELRRQLARPAKPATPATEDTPP